MFDSLESFFLPKSNSTTNASCPPSATWCTGGDNENGLCIQNPTLIPTYILALTIGLFCSKRISKLPGKFPSRWFYYLAFFLYGIMMTSAEVLHCFLREDEESSSLLVSTFAVIDAGLTSCIAVTFLFCGLCDVKFLNPQSILTHCLLFIFYLTLFALWSLGTLYHWSWIYHTLYVYVIGVCGAIYLLTQLCLKSRRSSLPALIVGGIYGGLGLLAKSYASNHICESEGPFWSQYIGPEFIWCLFADVSMAFIFIYVLRANKEKGKVIKPYPIDMEKYPEKF
jgi:hypothetical protein